MGRDIEKCIMAIVTDSAPVTEPKAKNTPLFNLYSLFLNKNEQQELIERYDSPGLRYGDVKKELIEKIKAHFDPYREKRNYFLDHPDDVHQILETGAKKATKIADRYLFHVREAMGLNYVNV